MKKIKLKTKSSVKKRFRLTAKGKVIAPQSGKRHGMVKRSKSNIRNQRGTTILGKSDSRIVKLYIPYGL
ncbi:50S ribosomal protein L35 [Wolbachia endosymbiont of Folsomia candida]|uniref:50S ribosomal protein L35 n=1 Tax=Wolbachia endosymbiont of Folsomia candida TaxID=169402 RepID=UPI000A8825B0|nr:50S ribosomal protein L35 [Wolbachia endosymbiont of Folsomia candida]APR98927.1 50S ribosomal protein L35 [Wolbachia endosymbiont of Folsomia candida]